MRISLLLQREPFGEILARTLERHWRERHGREIRVEWGTAALEQRWWGNSYLNFFAGAAIAPSAFEVLRREYSHSRVKWRRPLQKAYVGLATTHPSLRWFSNVRFSVSPALAGTEDLVVLGGNHRLRLLAPAAGRSTVILKEGFARDHLTREVELRTQLRPGCAPALLAADAAQGWFEEEYFAGTPINRLPPQEEIAHQEATVQAIWREVVAPTLRAVPVREWSDSLRRKIRALVAQNDATGGAEMVRLAEALGQQIEEQAGAHPMPVSWTHGDLQEANIVVNGTRRCVIDWEGADRRFAAYDFFQLATGGRWTDAAWATRVVRAVTGADARLGQWLSAMPGLHERDPIPTWWGLAYVLEELWFRARENAEPVFHRPGSDWPEIVWQAECARAALGEGSRT